VKRLTGVWLALGLALVLAVTAGSALAENPHNPGSQPGNSGNAPGQQKKDQPAATTTSAATPAAQPAQASSGKSDSAPGQQKKSTAQTQQSTAKPSSTAKSSHTAPDGSKQYGNGKSALQIAKQTKSSITIDDLSEPGNSGKHKVTICHNGHLITVDVHALKAHARHLDGSDVIPATSAAQCRATQSRPQGATQTQSAVCGSVTTTSTSTKVQRGNAYGRLKHGKPLHSKTVTKSETVPTGQVCSSSTGQNSAILASVVTIFGSSGNGSGTSGGVNGASSASGGSAGSGTAGTADLGGVAGISATLGSGHDKGGVLGIAATRVKGALPFTGFALWIAALIGASLLLGGVALRRRSRGFDTAS
jgi:hypothetical protein